MFDLERGAKITGSGFPVYTGQGSRLQRALIDFMLDIHTAEHGMTEIWPPAMVNAASARGTGQIPDKEDLMYVVPRDELYLVPTAEVPVTNLHRDEIFEADQLPIRYAAYSPCFRREAGAAGKDTRGILRVHQFDKVEMVFFEKPEASTEALEWLTGSSGGDPPAPRAWPIASCSWRRRTWASSRPRSTTWKSGRPASSAGSKSARARTSATTRPAATFSRQCPIYWLGVPDQRRLAIPARNRQSEVPTTIGRWVLALFLVLGACQDGRHPASGVDLTVRSLVAVDIHSVSATVSGPALAAPKTFPLAPRGADGNWGSLWRWRECWRWGTGLAQGAR